MLKLHVQNLEYTEAEVAEVGSQGFGQPSPRSLRGLFESGLQAACVFPWCVLCSAGTTPLPFGGLLCSFGLTPTTLGLTLLEDFNLVARYPTSKSFP